MDFFESNKEVSLNLLAFFEGSKRVLGVDKKKKKKF